MFDTIVPMAKTRRVFFFLYDGFEILDLSGPASVFTSANGLAGRPLYEIVAISRSGGPIRSSAGVTVATKSIAGQRPQRADTILVVGAEARPTLTTMGDTESGSWLVGMAPRCARLGSVCSGAFLLAKAGLLDGRSATTHWDGCEQLEKMFPAVSVEKDALYVRDDDVWTSAGVTTGIDMALAMLTEDHERPLATDVAKRLVVYAHRPGNQSQFSAVLSAQMESASPFGDLVDWLRKNLDRVGGVDDMARHAGMSVRSFHRKFVTTMHTTPAKFLDDLRMEQAKLLLEAGEPLKRIPSAIGYSTDAGFRRAFVKRFGVSPSHHAAMSAGDRVCVE